MGSRTPPPRVRPLSAVLAALVLVIATAAGCSSTSEGAAPRPAAAGACGTYPAALPPDPDGVLAALPPNIRHGYTGYQTPVHRSRWADWKPGPGGLVVGITWTAPVNDFIADSLSTIQHAVAALPGVSRVIVLAGAGSSDLPAQLQQYQSLVQQRVNLIIADAGAGTSFVPVVEAAAAAGIPTVSALNTVPSANAVNVVPNNYLANAETAASEMTTIGARGTVLEVHGVPGISLDTDAFRAFDDVLARCPEVKVAGAVTGNFSPAQAKSAVLQFLGTHLAGVDAVLQCGGMSSGIMSAIQSTGRPVPVVNDVAALKASLGYWLAHRSTYTGTGAGGGAQAFGELVSLVVQHMIAGDGVQVSDIVEEQPLITQDTITRWASPQWTLQTTGTAPDPPGTYDNEAIVNAVFAKAVP